MKEGLKTCKTCGEDKDRKEFRTDHNYTDGKRNDCKKCESNKTKARNAAKKDEYSGMGLSDIFHYEKERENDIRAEHGNTLHEM